MHARLRYNFFFISASAVFFLLACVGTAFAMIRVIRWSLLNCGTSQSCSIAQLLINYWWVVFVSTVLLLAAVGRRIYEKHKPLAEPTA